MEEWHNSFTETMEPGEPWTYRVEFRRIGSLLMASLREAIGALESRVREE